MNIIRLFFISQRSYKTLTNLNLDYFENVRKNANSRMKINGVKNMSEILLYTKELSRSG